MLAWYLISFAICSLVTGLTAFEPCRHIAFVGTVFSVAVAVGGEGLTTSRTNIFINRFLPDTLRVAIPPFLPTLRRTESLRFSARHLHYRLAAFGADSGGFLWNCFIRAIAHNVVSATESLNGVS